MNFTVFAPCFRKYKPGDKSVTENDSPQNSAIKFPLSSDKKINFDLKFIFEQKIDNFEISKFAQIIVLDCIENFNKISIHSKYY